MALVYIYLAVHSGSSRQTTASESTDKVLAMASILTWIRFASERVVAVNASSTMAGIRQAVIDVGFARES